MRIDLKKLLYFLAILIALISATQKWYFDIFGRIYFYEILSIVFIVAFCIYILFNKVVFNRKLKGFLLFHWGWFFLACLSSFMVIFFPIGAKGSIQFIKGIVVLFTYTVFLTLLVIFLSNLSVEERNKLVKVFILGVIISSIYALFQVLLIHFFNIDIDGIIWNKISYGLREQKTVLGLKFGYFYRLSGLTWEANHQASYILTALPLLFLYVTYERNYRYILPTFIVFVSFILTMSRSGMFGFFFLVLTLIVFFIRKFKIYNYSILLFFLISLLIFANYFSEDIQYFVLARLSTITKTSGHFELFRRSSELFRKNPLGYGLNNFSVAYEHYYGISNYNTHCSWLTFLNEEGFFGFLYQILFFIYIISKCIHRRTLLSRAFLASFIGIWLAAVFYETLGWFYVQLFLTLFFSTIILNDQSSILLLRKKKKEY